MTTDNPNNPDESTPVPEVSTQTGGVSTTTREQVREKAEQVKARLKRNRLIKIGVLGVVILGLIAAIGIVVTNTVSGAVNRPEVEPAGLDSDGIRVSPAGTMLPESATPGVVGETAPPATPEPSESSSTVAPVDPVEIRVYVDYLSTDAATFQTANAEQLAGLIRDEAVTVTYHPVATMTAKSNGTKYSLRAAAAAACVASYAPNHFYAYNYELLAQQPDADSDGMSDAQLADLAIALGTGSADSLRSCIANRTYEPWVKTVTTAATTENLPGTSKTLAEIPTILVNGTPYIGALDDSAEFMQFVMAAESKAYYETPSSSPTPSATPSAG